MMMRLVFQDSAFSDEERDGEELVQGREREGEMRKWCLTPLPYKPPRHCLVE